MNNSSSKSFQLEQGQACRVPSKGPCSRLRGRGAGPWVILAGRPLPTPLLPCPYQYPHSLAHCHLANRSLTALFHLPDGLFSSFLSREVTATYPLALPQDSHLGEKWLPAGLPWHVREEHPCPHHLGTFSVNCHLWVGLNPHCNHCLGGPGTWLMSLVVLLLASVS